MEMRIRLLGAIIIFFSCLQSSLSQVPEIVLEIGTTNITGIQWFGYDEGGSVFTALSGETNQTLTTTEPGIYFATYSGTGCASATIPAYIGNGSEGVLNDDVTLKAQSNDVSATFQWVRDGIAIVGETEDSITTNIAGRYGAIVSKNGCPKDTQFVDVLALDKIFLSVRVLLQGALVGVSDTLMRDDLYTTGHLPLGEPYAAMSSARFNHSGGESVTQAVLDANAGTDDAFVDWVLVELRDTANPATVVETRAVLLQRDGDIVDAATGAPYLDLSHRFGGAYYLSVKHRNHLGVMTAVPIDFKGVKNMDFRNAGTADIFKLTPDYSGLEMVEVNGKKALWVGDTNGDGKIKYSGSNMDLNDILSEVLTYNGAVPNTLNTYNFDSAFGYFSGDINMDGKVKYQGSNDDLQYILQNVLVKYTNNLGGLYNYDLFIEQIPK